MEDVFRVLLKTNSRDTLAAPSVCVSYSLWVEENVVARETPQDASHHSPGVADGNRVTHFHKLTRKYRQSFEPEGRKSGGVWRRRLVNLPRYTYYGGDHSN